MELDVLGTMRAIRNDESLTTTQLALLMCAVLRADNDSCKVKMSIEGLAKDANVSDKTARTAFQHPQVLKYMAKVEGRTRAKDMWFRPTPVTTTGIEAEAIPVTDGSIPVTEGPIPVTEGRIPVTVTAHLPSTSTTPSTSNSTNAPAASASVAGSPSLPQREVRESHSLSLLNKKRAALALPEGVPVAFEERTAAHWQQIRKMRPLSQDENEYTAARGRAYLEEKRKKEEKESVEAW